MRRSVAIALLLAACLGIGEGGAVVQRAESQGSGGVCVLQGYARTASGRTMAYHSPLPQQRQALITRACSDWEPIAWETEAVQLSAGQSTVRFAWMAGLGCNLGDRPFALRIGDLDTITLRTVDQGSWKVSGESGAILEFRGALRDHHGDRFGFLLLDLPADRLRAGERLRLEIDGHPADTSAGSQAWVMTFEEPLEEGVVVTPLPVLLRESGGRQPVDLSVLHLGEGTVLEVSAEGIAPVHESVPFGLTTVRLGFEPVSQPTPKTLEISLGGSRVRREVQLVPVRPWTLYMVQHTHTDIGYTRAQTEILGDHLRYIDYALDFCDATDQEPEDARFRWVCEVSWPVREYLRVRPREQIERLKKRVHEGRIELTAMPLNLGEVADEQVLASSLRWIADARAAGLPVETAMQNDVNGFPWCLIDPYLDVGVKYVSMGEHTHRALEPFEMPTVFWWESPAGNRILAYRADHYMTADFWGILGGDMDRLAIPLQEYLRDLERKGYAHNEISVQYVGYFTDNAPPSTFANDLIRRWNEKHIWPRLRSATMREFLAHIEKNHGDELPVHRAAWPDWWTDGFGSAMRETAAARRTQSDQIANRSLLAMARLLGEPIPETLLEQADGVDDLLLFYNEHTFGAAESVSDPQCENSQVQWLEKASYAWQAVMQARLLREGALGILQSHLSSDHLPVVTVLNTLNWTRSGAHVLFIDHQLLPRERQAVIEDEAGRSAPLQWLSARAEGSYWALWADDIPPLGQTAYRIRVGDVDRVPDPRHLPAGDILQNDWYRLTLDPGRGGVVSLRDKELDQELLDPQREWQLGEAIYERLAERASLERYELGKHTRTAWTDLRIEAGVDGPVWQSVQLRGKIDGFTELACEIRLSKTAKRIDFVYSGRKLPVSDPEALYVAFPFHLPDGQIVFEAQGGEVRPGLDQLPGTASDWNTVQSYAAVRSAAAQILLVSEQAPLMQFGAINTGRYDYEAKPASNQIFSWVLNNYWVTNFRTSQEGELRWSYTITSIQEAGPDAAARFGWGTRIPFVSRVRPPAAKAQAASRIPAPALEHDNLLLLHASPLVGGEGILLHLRETAGREVSLDGWEPSGLRAVSANALGEARREEERSAGASAGTAPGALRLPPYGTTFVRLEPSE